jgi:SAM-dependent methyltransferase
MDIDRLQRHWNKLGNDDPLWAILTRPEKRGGNWTPEDFFKDGENEISRVISYLESLRLPTRPQRALDFGCGVGRLTQALAAYCGHVVGIDIAPSMIDAAKRLNQHGDRCQYMVNLRPDLSILETGSFDFVYSNIVLQHMSPQYSHVYVREFVRLLRPGGVLLFQMPSEPSGTLIGRALRVLPMPVIRLVRKMDMFGTPRAEVIRLLESAQSEVVDVTPDECAGPHWISYRYCARKN